MTDAEIGPVMTDSEITTVFEGGRPQRAGDLRDLEVWGIAPIPENGRYGGAGRVFFPWFTGNMELSAVFLGTVAVAFGLGFGLGALALGIGIVLGAIPVAILCTWGPRTGTGQLPLARVPFGRSIVVPPPAPRRPPIPLPVVRPRASTVESRHWTWLNPAMLSHLSGPPGPH